MPKYRPIKDRLLSKYEIDPKTGCWLWTGAINSAGYASIGLSRRKETSVAHRVSFELFRGPIPEGLHVCHHCDVRHCINPAHLFLGTNAENMADRNRKGRARGGSQKGETNPQCRLTEKQVLAILADTRSQNAIAKSYGVSRGAICDIKRGRNWRHLRTASANERAFTKGAA